jgi:BirA family biotin operon repressor/biotin-[acetyl-CoA-carboxylase] ligase
VIGEPRLHVTECESTQLLLFDRAADFPEGAVVTADHQTAGRGRLGRHWVEAPGTAVLCSVLLRPPARRHAPQLALVAGLATAEAVELAAGVVAHVKWPNDVLVDGLKVAGILAEMRGEAVVVGIGINVNQTEEQLPLDVRVPAASFRSLTGREHDREQVLAALLERLDQRYELWKVAGLGALGDDLAARDVLRGRAVAVDGIAGRAAGIDADGRLVLEVGPGDVRAVESGQVELLDV